MIDYIELLKSHNLKATVQRTAILKSISKAGHISVEDIYLDIKKHYPTISLATIYKNIIVMLEHNVILELPINGEKPKYEIKKDDHIHTICRVCGAIKDVKITQERRELLNVKSFSLDYAQINLYGICKKCQSK